MRSNIILLISAITLVLCIGCTESSKLSEEAKLRGEEIAKELLKADQSDEMALQNIILKAKATKSEYILIGDSIAANDFENAYIEYIKATNDSLATVLF